MCAILSAPDENSSGDMKDIVSEVGRKPADWMFGRGADALRRSGFDKTFDSLLTFAADRFDIISAERRAPSAERRAPSALPVFAGHRPT